MPYGMWDLILQLHCDGKWGVNDLRQAYGRSEAPLLAIPKSGALVWACISRAHAGFRGGEHAFSNEAQRSHLHEIHERRSNPRKPRQPPAHSDYSIYL